MFRYEYDEPYAEPECFECSEKENKLDDVKYWLQAVLDCLYCPSEELEKIFVQYEEGDLEHHLEELAACLNMKLPKREIQVTRKENSVVRKDRTTESNISAMLNGWVEANNKYLKSLTYKNVGV